MRIFVKNLTCSSIRFRHRHEKVIYPPFATWTCAIDEVPWRALITGSTNAVLAFSVENEDGSDPFGIVEQCNCS